MTDLIPAERASVIRYPSTANLMIDSADRSSGNLSPWDFQITKTNSILNGFFTRVGTTEVTLEWFVRNIKTGYNDTIVVVYGGTPYTVTLISGFYTVATVLQAIVASMNTQLGSNIFSIGTNTAGSLTGLISNASTFLFQAGQLQSQLRGNTVVASTFQPIIFPDLRLVRYLDFVSSQLTYNQALKDSSTDSVARDVLCRWYMAYDDAPAYDQYGYPILMGYTPFVTRRIFNPPKQIRWDPQQPIGNLAFQVFDDQNNLFSTIDVATQSSPSNSNFLMTLQASEV